MNIETKCNNVSGIIDTGERKIYETGASREPKVGRFDLISPIALTRLAIWYEKGGQKYEDRNWEKGIPIVGCINAIFRHLLKWLMRWDGEDHMAAIAWNAFVIMDFEITKPNQIKEYVTNLRNINTNIFEGGN